MVRGDYTPHFSDWLEYQNFLKWKKDQEKPVNESWQRL